MKEKVPTKFSIVPAVSITVSLKYRLKLSIFTFFFLTIQQNKKKKQYYYQFWEVSTNSNINTFANTIVVYYYINRRSIRPVATILTNLI